MSLISYPQQRTLWPVPQTIPRQKTYLYITLICLTALFIYFYSYPLNMENWGYVREINRPLMFESIYKEESNVSAIYKSDSVSKTISRSTNSIFLQKLFLNKITSTNIKFVEDGKELRTTNFNQVGNSEEVLPVTVENGVSGLNVKSSRVSETGKHLDNSEEKSFTTSMKITREYNVYSLHTSKFIKHKEKIPEPEHSHVPSNLDGDGQNSKQHFSTPFKEIKGSLNFSVFAIGEEISKTTFTTLQKQVMKEEQTRYKPKEYSEKIITAYATENAHYLPTSESNRVEENSGKSPVSTSQKNISEPNFSSTSALAHVKNSKAKSLAALTKEQFVRSTPKSQLSTGKENILNPLNPEHSESAVVVGDTADVIEKYESATNAHDTVLKGTIDKNYQQVTNIHTSANNINSKFTDAAHATESTKKEKLVPTVTISREVSKVRVIEATRGIPVTNGYTTVLENTNTESILNKPTSTKFPKRTSDNIEHMENDTSVDSGVKKGYLVYSENCRIPDLDPMHPSILHLVEKTPPLDCSKGHEPLTWTEGYVLHLNKTAVVQRTSGQNYSCCYRSVKRKNDGKSDNDFEFGKQCIEIIDTRIIEDEFITVECSYTKNHTLFFREFHSFIHDKPDVEKRCNKHDKSQYSVLIIGADAVSRMNMHRQLNATAQYLLKEMEAIEMYGFNKVGDNTFPNLIPLLVGYDERELPKVCWKSTKEPLDECDFIWKRFARKGYRTLYAEDSPQMSSFNYLKEGFYHQPTDYYFRPFIRAYEGFLGRDKPLNCYLCVGSVSETEAVLHWTEQFAAHFSKRPHFAFSWINSLTHDFLNKGSSGDHMYERFLRTLHQKGALNRTILILMGDHGMRWGSIRHTFIGQLEERLPMLMIALPPRFKQEHPKFAKTLKQNSHRLVTPFDLHATLVHLLHLKDNWVFTNPDNVNENLSSNFTKRALSLFQPIPQDRSCDDAFIEEHWCTCETLLDTDVTNDAVKAVANFLVNHLNNLLKPVAQKCAHLTLNTISNARFWQPPSEHEGHLADDSIYTVVIHTNPGGAVFEGTMKISGSKGTHELLGTISRLNLYGNQSACVEDAIFRKYCYCL